MAPTITTIAAMIPSKSKYKITARATRIWEVNSLRDGKQQSLDFILLDKQGDHIHATIPRKLIASFREELQEGLIYNVSHFEVAKNIRSHRPVTTTNNILKVTPFTTIQKETSKATDIPEHKFEFHKLGELKERSNKDDYLIDVIGRLTAIEDKQIIPTSTGNAPIRALYIEDDDGNKVRATLWGDAADLIQPQSVKTHNGPTVVIITATKVNYYAEEYQLRSTYGTKIYTNLNIPETAELIKEGADNKVQHIMNPNDGEKEDPRFINRRTIQEIMDEDNKEETYTCLAKIEEVRTDVEWSYLSCKTCRRGINPNEPCEKCGEASTYPIHRYRIMLTISDGDTTTTLVLFDKEAEKVIGKPIQTLLDVYEKEDGKGKVYDILQQCIGKKFVIKVKLGTSKYGERQELKAMKTYTTTQQEEEEYAQTKANKEKAENTKESTKKPQQNQGEDEARPTNIQGQNGEVEYSRKNKREREPDDDPMGPSTKNKGKQAKQD